MTKSRAAALGRAIVFFGSLCAAAAVSAQTVPETNAVPNTGLNLPTSLTVFGAANPHLRKATAIVNSTIITGTDVDQRLALVLLANGGNIQAAEKERLRLQVLRNLIDEALQIQEAKSHDITISNDEIEQSYARVAQRFKRTPTTLNTYLKDAGSSARSMKRQIQGELAWSRLLRRRIEPNVNVSDEEVQQIIDRLKAAKGTTEFHSGEIYLSATPETQPSVAANAQKIIEQIKAGGSFQAYARQFSEASTAAVGGDMGWIRAAQLPDALATALQQMQIGQIAGPIAIPGGMSILYLMETHQVGMANPANAVLNLRQMSIKFAPGITQPQLTARAEAFAKATQAMGGCGRAPDVAKAFGAEIVDNADIRLGDLPAPLQTMITHLSIGQSTPPFGSPSEGIRVLVLCGRDDPAASGDPDPNQIRSAEEEKRVNARAMRYMRDLRRDAVVEYR